MTWFYSINGETKGPISEAQLRQLGLPDSALVWREGMPEWISFGASGLGAPSPGFALMLCQECGASVNPADAIRLEGMVICTRCKPVVLQKLQEGAQIGGAGDGPWLEGKHVVAKNNTVLTDRCFKCNHAADKHLKKKFYWHHPLLYLLAPWLLIYAIVAVCVRRQATLHIGVCAKHNRSRIFRRLIAVGLVFGGIGIMIFGVILSDGHYKQFSSPVIFSGLAVFLSSLVYAVATQFAIPKKITKDGYIWLKNSSAEFRNSLPKLRS